jgi:hypothetical protein
MVERSEYHCWLGGDFMFTIEQKDRIEAKIYTQKKNQYGEPIFHNGKPVVQQVEIFSPLSDGKHTIKGTEFYVDENTVSIPFGDVTVKKTLEPRERFAASNGGSPIDFVGIVSSSIIRDGIETTMLYFPK